MSGTFKSLSIKDKANELSYIADSGFFLSVTESLKFTTENSV